VKLRTGRGRRDDERVGAGAARPRSSPSEPASRRAERPAPTLLHPSLTRILVAVRDVPLHQEVLDFLGRDRRVDVSGSTVDAGQIQDIARSSKIDAIVCCPELASAASRVKPGAAGAEDWRPPAVHLVAGELSVPVLRLAVDVGARGAYRWPEERHALADRLRGGAGRRPGAPRGRGRVIAVVSARGGAGGTFVSAQLASSLAAGAARTVLVDGALAFSDLTPALGLSVEDIAETIADLRPVAAEMTAEHLDHVLREHPAGFAALLAPVRATELNGEGPGLVRSVLAVLSAEFDAVVLHLARGLDDVGLACVGIADVCVLVTTLDLFSLYGAKRLIDRLGSRPDTDADPGRVRVVVNRAARGELSAAEVQRILGVAALQQIRMDPAVPKAQGRGELLPPGSTRAACDVDRLASILRKEIAIASRAGEPE